MPAPSDHAAALVPRRAVMVAMLVTLAVVALKVTAPWDILDNDQLRPLSYVLDIARNGHWIVQHDGSGEVASKPPMYAWIAGAVSLITGRAGPFELAVPSAIGVLIGAIAVAIAGARVFGGRTACFAAVAFVLTPLMVKQSTLARTDALFAGLTAAAALLAFRAFERRTGWWEFWAVAALATLTKGPLALVIATAGLLFVARGRTGHTESRRRRWAEHLMGIALFLALCGGWFAAAWIHDGQPFIDKVIGRELVGHVVSSGGDAPPLLDRLLHWLAGLFKPTLYLLWHALPWSIPAGLGVIGVFREPSDDPAERRLERFLAGWLLIGLAIFSVAPHQRADLLSPIWAPGALLAARWMARRTPRWTARADDLAMIGATIAVLTIASIQYHLGARRSEPVIRLAEIRAVLRDAEHAGAPAAMITPTDGSYLATALCNTAWARLSAPEAARLLASDAAAFVSTRSPDDLVGTLRAQRRPVFILSRCDEIAIVSNRRAVEPTDTFAARLNGLHVEAAACRIEPPMQGVFMIDRPASATSVVSFRNVSSAPRTFRWRSTLGESGRAALEPGEETIITLRPASPAPAGAP